jgi:hypothetical protein
VSRRIVVGRWAIGVALAALGAFYAVEDLRLRSAAADAQTEALTFYYSTLLKNGRVQVFYDQPQREVCVRAVFPHGGRRPCWYARREPVRRVS